MVRARCARRFLVRLIERNDYELAGAHWEYSSAPARRVVIRGWLVRLRSALQADARCVGGFGRSVQRRFCFKQRIRLGSKQPDLRRKIEEVRWFDFGRHFRLMPDLWRGSVKVHRQGSASSKGSDLAASSPIFAGELRRFAGLTSVGFAN